MRRLPSANKVLRLIRGPRRGDAPHCGGSSQAAGDAAGAEAFVICDKKLKKLPALKSRLADPRLAFYFAEGGESFKSIEKAPLHFKAILRLAETHSMRAARPGFISLGGGSISDFTGFAASVYQRGAPLVHIPSTWLAAMDSAHGGKSALNVSGAKNAIGSFHFPKAVFIVEELLETQPLERKTEALGELLKTALIAGGGFYKQLCAAWPLFFETPSARDFSAGGFSSTRDSAERGFPSAAALKKPAPEKPARKTAKAATPVLKNPWQKFLRRAVAFKAKTVQQDPLEQGSLRRKLNLGHTAGHVIEAACKLPHGLAVAEGLLFSAKWSARKKFLDRRRLQEIQALLSPLVRSGAAPIPRALFQSLVRKDKKYTSPASLDFVFLKGPGGAFVQNNVKERDLMQEAERQGLTTKAGNKNSY